MYPRAISEAVNINGVWYQDYEVQDPATGAISVKKFKHDGANWVEASDLEFESENYKVNIMKMIPDNQAGINLKKNVVNLDKCIVNLSKSKGVSLTKHRARVAVVLDYSYSMKHLYDSGAVQKAVSRLVPLGLRFDDNGEIEVWLFHDGQRAMDAMTLNNYDNYTKSVVKASREDYGGTRYAPVLEDIKRHYVNEDPSDVPTFVIFITDGDNSDHAKTDNIVKELSNYNVFIQFVGIGHSSFNYLEKLDDLTGRRCDNTGFIKVSTFDSMDDTQLYNSLLEQYIDWLKVLGLN